MENENPIVRQSEVLEVEAVPLVEAQTRAEIDVQISTARRYPRSLAVFRKQVLEMATLDQDTAESCWYALPRKDKDGRPIEGPSIRFAEIVLSCYGNLRAATRPSNIDEDSVTAQAICMDLEKNVGVQIENKRRIKDKYGKRYSDDMILMTTNAAVSIALRNAVFRIVPKAIYKRVLDEVKTIAMGEGRTLEVTRTMIVEHFKKLGVTVPMLCSLLERTADKPHRGIEDITLEDATYLRGIATAIKDDQVSVEETFSDKPVTAKATIPAGAIRAGKTAEHTHPSVPPSKKPAASAKSTAQQIADARNELRALTKNVMDDGLAVDLDAAIFSAGIDSIDRCEDVAAMQKAIDAIKAGIKEAGE